MKMKALTQLDRAFLFMALLSLAVLFWRDLTVLWVVGASTGFDFLGQPILKSISLDLGGSILFLGCLILRDRPLARVCLGIAALGCLIRNIVHLFHFLSVGSALRHAANMHPSLAVSSAFHSLAEAEMFSLFSHWVIWP
jgi:hypothetical protein